MAFQTAANVMIIKNNKFLILKRYQKAKYHKGYWNFPGGTTNLKDKDILETLAREVKEETGNVKYKLLGLNSIYNYNNIQTEPSVMCINFVAKYLSGNIKLNKESPKYKWATIYQIKKIKITPCTKLMLKAYQKGKVLYEFSTS